MINLSEEVAGIMSLPRVGFVDNGFAMGYAMRSLGILVSRYQGAFWEQGIEKMIRTRRHRKYILTIDFDTYFTEYHIIDLYNIMEKYPEIDVLFPMQTKRNGGVPMFQAQQYLTGGKRDSGAKEMKASIADFEQDWLDADTGHFGLTIIRSSCIDKLEKPWLEAKANANGEWEDGKVDADMAFWYNCQRNDVKVALAPKVFIGHLELVCSIPGKLVDAFKTFYLTADDVTCNVWPSWAKPESAPEPQKK